MQGMHETGCVAYIRYLLTVPTATCSSFPKYDQRKMASWLKIASQSFRSNGPLKSLVRIFVDNVCTI